MFASLAWSEENYGYALATDTYAEWHMVDRRVAIPVERRCWRCESEEIHGHSTPDACLAELCRTCCDELKGTT